MSKLRVWTDTESIEVDVDEDGVLLPQLVTALRFKAKNIQAKADPEIFATAADVLESCIGYMERAEKHFVEKHIKHGHWLNAGVNNDYFWLMQCSECRGLASQVAEHFVYEFCPHCGAKMDEKAE